MTAQTIALSRFGLGARFDQQAPANPQRWLLDQFDRYDPSPVEIADAQSSQEVTAAFLDYRAMRRDMRRAQRNSQSGSDGEQRRPPEIRQYNRAARRGYMADAAARGMIAVRSDAPFIERMVHFWSNHFAVSVAKRQVTPFAGPYEFGAIRPHVLGKFADMLQAAVLNPAMLLYLDQAQSVGPNSPAATRVARRGRREPGLNENLAREILELHTLGVGGGYSQTDLTEFARALTGFTLPGRRARNAVELGNGSIFAAPLHEPGTRTLLGRSYRQSDGQQALAILGDIASHPATARHIATKLAGHFSTDDPPESLIARLERTFLASGGDLPTVYRALIGAPEPWQQASTKFRSPWDWSIAAFRATGADDLQPRRFMQLQNELGQRVWAPKSPAGYADTTASWAGPDALVRRIEVAERIGNGAPDRDGRKLAKILFPDALNDSTATAIARAESPAQGLALLLASPEMMRR